MGASMRQVIFAVLLALQACSAGAPGDAPKAKAEDAAVTNFKKITPVLLAEDVGACLAFWNALGVATSMSVPFERGIGFAAVAAGDVELMYQSVAMARAQDPKAIEGVQRAVVYLEVRALNDVLARLGDAEVVVPVRETGHGTREIYVRDPAGNLIGFSEALEAEKQEADANNAGPQRS